MYIVHVYGVLVMCTVCSGVRLLKRDLSGYELAKCNDGTTAAYYHDQDVRPAGDKVLIYLPDGGDCGSVGLCTERCKEDPSKCSATKNPQLELHDGIWSSNITDNPFAEYFKIFIHYCSSDNFAGTRGGSPSTGNFYFHGKHILTATMQDLVASFGIERAGTVILAGSGSGGKGVGYNCDFVSSALRGVNPDVDVRCLADGPDFVPWWVKTGAEQCEDQDQKKLEKEKFLWGRMDDDSCVEENKDILSSTSLAHRCGLLSRYWQDLKTPLLVVASQLDPVYYKDSPCTPGVEDAQYEDYRAAWRRGVVALAESIQASRPNRTSCFVPSCASHTLLAGSLAQVYLAGVQVQVIQGEGTLTLREMIERWLRSDYQQAVDPLGKENSQCPTPSPLRTACGNLLGCGTRTGVPRKSVYHAQSFNHRLLPPTSLFPTTYSRKCTLDPWYGACGRRAVSSVHGAGHGASRTVGFTAGHGDVHPGIAQDEAGRRKRLWQKLYYLQHLKKLFNKYKQAYAREYHAGDVYPSVRTETRPVVVREKSVPAIVRRKRPRVIIAPRRVPTVVTVERPPAALPSVPAPDYDYDYASVDYDYAPVDYDYAEYDYAEYYDYAQGGCDTGCALAKIVRAARLKQKNNKKSQSANTDIPAGRVTDDEELLKKFREFLVKSDLDYEDFGPLNSQVETLKK